MNVEKLVDEERCVRAIWELAGRLDLLRYYEQIGKTALVNVRRYEGWMSKRSHLSAVDANMQRSAITRLRSLHAKKASFVEAMECLSVARNGSGRSSLMDIEPLRSRPEARDVALFSRRPKSLNRQFPYIVERLADLPDGTVVDGELVAIDDIGRPNFHLLQNFRSEASRIHYYIFDLLCCADRI